MIRKHGSEFKRQGSWNESQNASPRHPVRALSECEDIRLGTSVGENMIFIDGGLQTQAPSTRIRILLKTHLFLSVLG